MDVKERKRTLANERLRAGFLVRVEQQLGELAELLQGEPDAETRDSAVHELGRLADTAQALGLDALADSARAAIKEVGESRLNAALREVAQAARQSEQPGQFGLIAIVATGEKAEQLQSQASLCAEPVRIVASLADYYDGLDIRHPFALALPMPQAGDVQVHAANAGFPYFVYGDDRDWSGQLDAIEGGASGFLPADFEVLHLVDRVRWLATRRTSPPEVFILAAASPERDALVEAFANAAMTPMASASPEEIVPALEVVCPDALVVGAEIGDRDAMVVVKLARSHVYLGDVPVLIIGDAADAAALYAAGADDVLPPDVDPRVVVSRIDARCRRIAAIRRDRDPVTGLPNRTGVLRSLDRLIAASRRRNQQLVVGVVLLDGMEEARQRWGKASANAAQRTLAHCLEGGLRRVDLVGQLDGQTFLVGVTGCDADEVRKRMDDIRQRFARLSRSDHRLRHVGIEVGIADTEATVDRLVLRAEQDLRTPAAKG